MMNALKLAFSVDIKARVEETAGLVPVAGAEINAHEIEPGLVYERDGLRVSAIRVDHRAIAPAYGYRIDYSDRSVVLSGDISVSEAMYFVDFVRPAGAALRIVRLASCAIGARSECNESVERARSAANYSGETRLSSGPAGGFHPQESTIA
jgi:hypothetical protein